MRPETFSRKEADGPWRAWQPPCSGLWLEGALQSHDLRRPPFPLVAPARPGRGVELGGSAMATAPRCGCCLGVPGFWKRLFPAYDPRLLALSVLAYSLAVLGCSFALAKPRWGAASRGSSAKGLTSSS